MAHQVKMPSTKTDETHISERELRPASCPLTSIYTLYSTCAIFHRYYVFQRIDH